MAALHHNFDTHHGTWRDALMRLIELETDEDQKIFWKHELKAYDDAYKNFEENTKEILWEV